MPASGHRELERAGGEAREREAGEGAAERAGLRLGGAGRLVEPDGAGGGVVPEHRVRDHRHDRAGLKWRAALVVFAAAAVAGWASFATFPQYDSLYAFVWAREIWDGSLPGFDAYRAPTEHPLLFPFALALAPLGDTGLRIFVLFDVLSFVALVAAVWRLGRAAAGILGAVLAAALVASRLNLPLLASIGFLDIPYCALVAWAAVLEVERPRRGGPVFALLALAGLLRPEAWLLAGLYVLRMGWRASWGERVRYAAMGAVAPLLWSLTDLVVTGDPLFSLLHTDGLALELQRERPLETLPWLMVRLLAEILKWPVLLTGAAGLLVALSRRRGDLWVVMALVPATAFTYLVIATGGLPTVYRYLLVAAIALAVFAAYALAGWTTLDRTSPWRARWAAVALVLLAGGATFTVLNTSPRKVVAELETRERIRDDLRDLVEDPAFARVAACGPITVPNHKLVPEIRWLLDLPEDRVRARSDRSLGVQRSGAAVVIDRRIERRPALDIGEVPRDGGRAIQQPPPGFELLGGNRSFAVYGACR